MNRFKNYAADATAIFFGDLLMALGMVIFTIPNNLAPGGVSGLATAIGYVTKLPIGALTFTFNVPILLIAWRMFGIKSLAKTICASIVFSLLIDLLRPYLPTYTNNILLASILGGALIGAGVGVAFSRGVTTGGTDMVSLILRRPFPQIPAGTLLMIIDAVVIVIAVIIFRDIEVALYSGVAIFVQGKVIDAIMQGLDFAKVVMIITVHPQEVTAAVSQETERGVTEFEVRGGYTGEKKAMLMTVVRRSEVSRTLHIVKQVDPKAFTILHNATEVRGEGFKGYDVL
ncbi:MAG: YitT family protein [Clostridiaceae bacterium]|nr:YitT family protein [Eubacteriales bacterium]